MKNVVVLIVTYNRKDLLIKSISTVLEQVYNINEIVLVDNNSNDGTEKALADRQILLTSDIKHDVIYNNNIEQSNGHVIKTTYVKKSINDGGSGGYYWGLDYISKNHYDWVWIMDDDAFLTPTTISDLMKFSSMNNVAALTATVIDKNGNIDIGHRKRIDSGIAKRFVPIEIEEYKNQTFDLDLYSYVGTCLRHDALLKAGLPEKDFFIFYDDTEHSIRVSKLGRIVNICSSEVHHQANITSSASMSSNWKTYYQYRNSLRTYKRHFNIAYYILHLKVICKMCISMLLLRTKYSNMLWNALRDR